MVDHRGFLSYIDISQMGKEVSQSLMNSLQLHKLSLMSLDKQHPEETRRLIRLLLEERMEMLQALTRIQEEANFVGNKGMTWKV